MSDRYRLSKIIKMYAGRWGLQCQAPFILAYGARKVEYAAFLSEIGSAGVLIEPLMSPTQGRPELQLEAARHSDMRVSFVNIAGWHDGPMKFVDLIKDWGLKPQGSSISPELNQLLSGSS